MSKSDATRKGWVTKKAEAERTRVEADARAAEVRRIADAIAAPREPLNLVRGRDPRAQWHISDLLTHSKPPRKVVPIPAPAPQVTLQHGLDSQSVALAEATAAHIAYPAFDPRPDFGWAGVRCWVRDSMVASVLWPVELTRSPEWILEQAHHLAMATDPLLRETLVTPAGNRKLYEGHGVAGPTAGSRRKKKTIEDRGETK